MAFPERFTWGVSTASYQIEGAAYEDGKGESVWDVFAHTPGKIYRDQTGDVAIDHYHRYRDDVALMKEFGIGAYRFSVSWPRVLPDGVGAANEQGLAFYDRLLDELLAAGITPHLMLFHWDYPMQLFRRGGWLHPDSSDWFADYASLLVERYSDRIAHWYTLEELPCFIGLGLYNGIHAPGLQLPLGEVLQAGHHALLGHGKAVQAMRARAKQPLTIGLVPSGEAFFPADESNADDVEAARAMEFAVTQTEQLFHHSWWLDPIYLGRYPEEGLRRFGSNAPRIADGDLELINQPIDVCAINFYHAKPVRAGADGIPEVVDYPVGYPRTTQDEWAVTPQGLYYGLKFFHERYGLPMIVTENGHQNHDFVMLDGRVHDPERIDYTRRHLLQVERAIADGIPVTGYLHWTFMDNFEWAWGYKIRVGLVYTDYTTQKRTPKDSAYWYRDVIATNGAQLHTEKYHYQ